MIMRFPPFRQYGFNTFNCITNHKKYLLQPSHNISPPRHEYDKVRRVIVFLLSSYTHMWSLIKHKKSSKPSSWY